MDTRILYVIVYFSKSLIIHGSEQSKLSTDGRDFFFFFQLLL